MISMMTYEEAIAYADSLVWKGSRPGLDRITELCRRLGNPQKELRFIHIAGTNGKGSVSAMLDAILRAAGYRVGLFTSPHIERFGDRIRCNGADIPDEELARATEEVKACADAMVDGPTVFELVTAIALVFFRNMRCDYVVWECGLGGRLDSTNVVDTTVLSVITGIALDHCHILGDTTEQIAGEKAGIIKSGVPVLFGEGDAAAEAVIRHTAAERGCAYMRTDFSAISQIRSDLSGTEFRVGERPVRIPLVGLYQTRNTATALNAVALLRRAGVSIPEAAITAGLANVRWKARFEVLSREPLVIYDGAHNPQGIAGALENIRTLLVPHSADGKVVLVMGVMADKDHRRMVEELAPYASAVMTVRPDRERSMESQDLAESFRRCGVSAVACDTPAAGMAAALPLARRESRPLVCLGSLYMYGEIKDAVKRLRV